MKSIAFVASIALLTGCAAQVPLSVHTQSGYAEGIFEGLTMDEVSSRITERCINKGFTVEDSNKNSVVCSKEETGGGAVLAQLMIGNSYSTTPVSKIRFVMIHKNQQTRVVAYPSMSTQMAFGQVKSVEMNSANTRNNIQKAFAEMGAK